MSQRSSIRNTNKKHACSPKTQVCCIRHNDRATMWEKHDEDGWRTIRRDLRDKEEWRATDEITNLSNEEEKTSDAPYIDSDQETSDSSRGIWSPAISKVLQNRYSACGKRTPRTISRLLKHHRESERNRHHGINATIHAICAEQVPGHIMTPGKKETKIDKLQKIINYICHLEENIHDLADEMDIKLDFKNMFLSAHCNEDREDRKVFSPKPSTHVGRRSKRIHSYSHRQEVKNKGKGRFKISSPTVDSTTPDRPKQSRSEKCSGHMSGSSVDSPKTPVRGKGKRNWLQFTPRKDITPRKSTINEDDLESLGIGSPFLPTFLPSPDTTTMLSTEDCDQVLSVLDCPTPISDTDSLVDRDYDSLTEFSDSDLFLEDVLDSVENVHVVPSRPFVKQEDTENNATLVTVEVPSDLEDDPESEKKDKISKIFETGRCNLSSNPISGISSGVSAFHSYAKDPNFPLCLIPERKPELDFEYDLEVPGAVSEIEVSTSESNGDFSVKKEKIEKDEEVYLDESPSLKRFQTIREASQTTPTVKGFLKSGKGIANEKYASRCSSACSIASTASGSPLRRSRRRPKPINRSPFLPLSSIVVRDGEVTIKKEKEQELSPNTFYWDTDSESENEENEEPLTSTPKVDNRKTSWMNGFMMYSRLHRGKYIKANRGIHTSNISKKMGQDWKRLSPEEKEPYSEQAKTYADQYLKPRFQAELSQQYEERSERESVREPSASPHLPWD